jgi:hypothetical protein
VDAVEFSLAPRFASAPTVLRRPIEEAGGVAVAEIMLASSFATTATSPAPLRRRATGNVQARVTGVASLLLPPRLARTSVTPMAEERGTGEARWTRRRGLGGAERVSWPTHCPGHVHRHEESRKGQGTTFAPLVTCTSIGLVGSDVTVRIT